MEAFERISSKFGLLPDALESYFGCFMWHKYCKQRNLDMFKHFLECAVESRPPTSKRLPKGVMDCILKKLHKFYLVTHLGLHTIMVKFIRIL